MALAATTGTASFDQNAGVYLDLSNELALIVHRDNTAFISRIGMGGEATEVIHSWMEDALNPMVATAAEAIDNSETAIDVATGHGTRFRVGTLFKVKMQGKTEVMQVTGISSDTLTVVRGYGSTSAEDYGATTDHTLQIIAHPDQEGQDYDGDESTVRTKVSNYTQIFSKKVRISHTLRQVLQAGVADEFTFQVAQRLLEIHRELNSAVINGISGATSGSDSAYRSMAGLIEFASQAGGNTDDDAEDLTPTVLNDMCKQIWDDGGTANFVLVSGKQKRVISGFDQAYRRSSYDGTVAGYVVDKFISDLGFVLDVIVDPSMPDDTVVVGDLAKCKVMPLRGDAMRVEELAKLGRTHRALVTGQYTFECRNAKESFAIHTNLN